MTASPDALSLLRALRRRASLRLEGADGRTAVLRDGGAAEVRAEVGSRPFVEAVDALVLSWGEKRVVPPAVMADLVGVLRECAAIGGTGTRRSERADLDALRITAPTGFLPRRLDAASPTTDLDLALAAAKRGANVLLVGPTGSGKTLLASEVAFRLALPLVRVELHSGLETADLTGSWVRRRGEWAFAESPLVAAMREGGVVLLDEIDSAPPALLARLHGLLDARALTLAEHSGERVVAHPRTAILATANSLPAPRLLRRFPVVLETAYDERTEARLVRDPRLLALFASLRADGIAGASTALLASTRANLAAHGLAAARSVLLANWPAGSPERATVEARWAAAVAGRNARARTVSPPHLRD